MAWPRDEVSGTEAQRDLAHAHQALFNLGMHMRTRRSASGPLVVQAAPDHVEVLFRHPVVDCPDGWVCELDDRLLVTNDPELEMGCRAEPPPRLSVLAPIGARDPEGQIFIDLEAQPILALVGEDRCVAAALDDVIGSLVDDPSEPRHTLVIVGDHLASHLNRTGQVERFSSWAQAEPLVTTTAIQGSRTLASHGWPSTFIARAAWPTRDDLQPTVIISYGSPPSGTLDVLENCHPAPVSIIAVGTSPPGVPQIVAETDRLLLPNLALTCRAPTRIAPSRSFVDETARDEPDDAPPSSVKDAAAVPASPDLTAPHAPEYDVLVRLLGDITVEGGRRALSPKPTALVAYIALHRDVSSEQLEEACWSEPGFSDHRRRLWDLASQCRAAIGAANLPIASDGRYRAGPRLLTDLDLFSWHTERAVRLAPADAAAAYRSALDLVTGRIFTYPGKASTSYVFIDVENLVNQWEVRIAGVTQQCAATYLDLGNPAAAIEVLNHVAAALPLHSGLTEMLMRAHARMGDLHAVRTTYAAYGAALNDLRLDIEPSVQDVFNELVRP